MREVYRGTPFGGGSMVDAGLDRPEGDGRGHGHYRGGLALTGAEGPPSRKIPPADLHIPIFGQLPLAVASWYLARGHSSAKIF
jgi:hypothetical protein